MSKRLLCILLALMMMPAMLFMNYDMVVATEDGTAATESDTTATEGGVTDPGDGAPGDEAPDGVKPTPEGLEAYPQIVEWGELLQNIGIREWTDKEKGKFINVSNQWMWDSDYSSDYRLETLGEHGYIAWMCQSRDGVKEPITDSSSYNFLINVKQRIPRYGSIPGDIVTTPGKTLGSLIPYLGTPKDINGDPLAGTWSWQTSKGVLANNNTILNGGNVKYRAVFTPTSPNYSTRVYSVTINVKEEVTHKATYNPIEKPESWGEPIEVAGQTLYVAPDGTVSAEVKKDGLTWLKDNPGGEGAWCAIDNAYGQFEAGSRFWVRWLNKEDCDEWSIDKFHKNKINTKKMIAVDMGVTSPEGTAYKNFEKPVDFHIQLGDDWDKDDIAALFISAGKDETLEVSYNSGIKSPEESADFAVMKLKHFSTYIIYEEKSDK